MTGDIGAQVYHSGSWHTYQYNNTNEIERRGFNPFSSKIVYVDLPRADRLRFYLRLNSGIAHTEEELDRVRKLLVGERA